MPANNNICRFVPVYRTGSDLNILNFVYEKTAVFPTSVMSASFVLHLVTQGEGMLRTPSGIFPVKAGDLFLKYPTKQYSIENRGGLEYIYVSFLGKRTYFLLDRAPFTPAHPVISGYGDLKTLWEAGVTDSGETGLDLAAEGILLYTFSRICPENDSVRTGEKEKKEDNWILQVKDYVDRHYIEQDLTLQSASARCAYDYKYVSDTFRRTVGVGFTQYLNLMRLDCARHLMDSGCGSIKEVAAMSGYRDALYFSKLFHKQYGVTPRDYLQRTGNHG